MAVEVLTLTVPNFAEELATNAGGAGSLDPGGTTCDGQAIFSGSMPHPHTACFVLLAEEVVISPTTAAAARHPLQ